MIKCKMKCKNERRIYIKKSYLLFYRNKMISGQLAGRAKLTIVTDMYFRILENVLSTEAHSVEKCCWEDFPLSI